MLLGSNTKLQEYFFQDGESALEELFEQTCNNLIELRDNNKRKPAPAPKQEAKPRAEKKDRKPIVAKCGNKHCGEYLEAIRWLRAVYGKRHFRRSAPKIVAKLEATNANYTEGAGCGEKCEPLDGILRKIRQIMRERNYQKFPAAEFCEEATRVLQQCSAYTGSTQTKASQPKPAVKVKKTTEAPASKAEAKVVEASKPEPQAELEPQAEPEPVNKPQMLIDLITNGGDTPEAREIALTLEIDKGNVDYNLLRRVSNQVKPLLTEGGYDKMLNLCATSIK